MGDESSELAFRRRFLKEIMARRQVLEESGATEFEPWLLLGTAGGYVTNKIDSEYIDQEPKMKKLITRVFPKVIKEQRARFACFFVPQWVVQDHTSDLMKPLASVFVALPGDRLETWAAPWLREEDGTVWIGRFEPFEISGGSLLGWLRTGFTPILSQQ